MRGGTKGWSGLKGRGRWPRAAAVVLGLTTGLGFLATTGGVSSAPASATSAALAAVTTSSSSRDLVAGQQVTIHYCDNQKARITEPTTVRGPAPAAVYVHGGSWVSGDYDTGGFIINSIGPALTAKGFVVVSLNYRLGPKQHWPDQIVDVKCAIRYLRANAKRFHIDKSAIGAWGQSAGGHLVALLGTARKSVGWDVGAYPAQSSGVQAVVDMAGPSDLLTMGDQGAAVLVAESFISLLGDVPSRQIGADLKKASPVSYVRKGDPPFLILDSNNDEIVYPQQSEELAWYLGIAGVPHELLTVHNGGHEFDTVGQVPSEAGVIAAVVDFFERTLVEHKAPAPGNN
jgi:acetyl esterase/lipase